MDERAGRSMKIQEPSTMLNAELCTLSIKTTFAKLQDIVWPLTRNQEVIYGEEDEDVTCI